MRSRSVSACRIPASTMEKGTGDRFRAGASGSTCAGRLELFSVRVRRWRVPSFGLGQTQYDVVASYFLKLIG